MTPTDHRKGILPAMLAGLGGAYLLPGLAPHSQALRGALGVADSTIDKRGCMLTFDDGPHPEGTPAILAALARRGAVATFFLVGEQVARDPALAAEVAAAGHRIGLHCDRHRTLMRLSPGQVREDMLRAQSRIEVAAGVQIDLYRPPYGAFNAAALLLARSFGWRPLLWSHWGRDWEARATPGSIAQRLSAGVGEGSVLLLHDADDYGSVGSWRRTLGALPLLFEQLDRRGLELASG